jgi:hypothetical protein
MSFNSLGSLISLNVDVGGSAPAAAPPATSTPSTAPAASSDSIQNSGSLQSELVQLIQELTNVLPLLGGGQPAATTTAAQTGTSSSPATSTSTGATDATSGTAAPTSEATDPTTGATDPSAATAATAAGTADSDAATTDADTGTATAASGSTGGQSASAPAPSAPPQTQPATSTSSTFASSASKKPAAKHAKHAKDAGPQERFTSVAVSSKGDPHETISGKTASGKSFTDRWNSMTAHATLLDSNSFGKGYTVSSEVTAPNARGVTHNKSVSIDDGNTHVTMTNNGTYRVTSGDHVYTPSDDHPVHLGNGETITLGKNRSAVNGVSLTVTQTGAHGAKLETTLEAKHGGVNVSATGQNVELGGYLVRDKHNTGDPDPKPESKSKPISAK